MAGLVYMALTAGADKPRDLLRHMNVRAEISQPDGLKKIYQILDSEYVKPSYRKSDEAQRNYEKQRRRP